MSGTKIEKCFFYYAYGWGSFPEMCCRYTISKAVRYTIKKVPPWYAL